MNWLQRRPPGIDVGIDQFSALDPDFVDLELFQVADHAAAEFRGIAGRHGDRVAMLFAWRIAFWQECNTRLLLT